MFTSATQVQHFKNLNTFLVSKFDLIKCPLSSKLNFYRWLTTVCFALNSKDKQIAMFEWMIENENIQLGDRSKQNQTVTGVFTIDITDLNDLAVC